jgi:hypothetical protein
MNSDKRIENIESMLEKLLAACAYETQVPISLRDAAVACNVTLRWLQERVNREEITAYRHDETTSWRVFPKDIRAFLMAESNQKPARRMRVLRRA